MNGAASWYSSRVAAAAAPSDSSPPDPPTGTPIGSNTTSPTSSPGRTLWSPRSRGGESKSPVLAVKEGSIPLCPFGGAAS